MRRFWRFNLLIKKFIFNERLASFLRILFFGFFTLMLILAGYYIFEDIDTTRLELEWAEKNPIDIFDGIVVRMVLFASFVKYSFRFWIIPFGVFSGVLLASAYYVQDIYELPKYSLAVHYVFASFFGFPYPRLVIENGEMQIPKGETNLINEIGGPGIVLIRPGNVVLFESLRSPSSVRSKPLNLISRFETIKEIVSLDDHHGFIEEMKVKTKDGIDLLVKDVHFRYRLRTGRRYGDYEKRQVEEPYHYSIQAVKDMAYNRTVGGQGLSEWHATIKLRVDGGITDYIKAHTFDHLTAPTYEDNDPRKIIRDQMLKGGLRAGLRNFGAELLWLDIGHFEVAETMIDTVAEQRVDTWGAKWDGEAMIVRAHGEARRMAYQEMGRAEGQADLLLSILQALDEAGFEEGLDEEKQRRDSLRRIIWARVAQIFDTAAEEEQRNLSEGRNPRLKR